jgi:predicted RNase H-like HicB family nuclease
MEVSGTHMQEFSFDAHIFKEGDTFVAYVPALDVSSCGTTDEEARKNIRDAVRGFLETSADIGTLDELLHNVQIKFARILK